MVTKEQAVELKRGTILTHVSTCNKDGSPLRVRVNGATKTWKTRPTEFKIPVKYGLYSYGYITDSNASKWSVA